MQAIGLRGITDSDTTEGTVLVGVLTRSRTESSLPRGEKWSTLLKPTAEGMLKPSETQAFSRRDAGSSQTDAPYGKIPSALTTFLLSL